MLFRVVKKREDTRDEITVQNNQNWPISFLPTLVSKGCLRVETVSIPDRLSELESRVRLWTKEELLVLVGQSVHAWHGSIFRRETENCEQQFCIWLDFKNTGKCNSSQMSNANSYLNWSFVIFSFLPSVWESLRPFFWRLAGAR